MRPTSFAEIIEILVAVREETSKPQADDARRFLNVCLRHAAESHGQLLQDLWAVHELQGKRDGFFVEFGAADGVVSSNTCFLERKLGWRGILAEPARVWQTALRRNRSCSIDERCVWVRSGERLVFNQPKTILHSTIDSYSAADHHAASREAGERYEVETVSLMDLLRTWDAPRRIDYLSIDTEGSELDILSAFDFSAYDIRLITVEHNHTDKRQGLFQLLTAHGYQRKFEALSDFDDWYVRAG